MHFHTKTEMIGHDNDNLMVFVSIELSKAAQAQRSARQIVGTGWMINGTKFKMVDGQGSMGGVAAGEAGEVHSKVINFSVCLPVTGSCHRLGSCWKRES